MTRFIGEFSPCINQPVYRCTPIAVLYIPGIMKLLSNALVAGTEKDTCWLVGEVEPAGWLMRGIAKKLPFPADAAGTSTRKQAKQKGKVISLLEVKGAKEEISIDIINHLILISCVLIFQKQEQFTLSF